MPWSPLLLHVLTHVSTFSPSLLGDMFPMFQLIRAMAEDGLLFQGLARVCGHTKIPIMAIMSSGNLAGE